MDKLTRQFLVFLVYGFLLMCIVFVSLDPSPARADMGVQPILPGGSSLKPEEETPIQMLAEKVVLNVRPATAMDDTIVARNPEEYGLPASFGGSPGMYPAVAEVLADFTMFNPTNEAVSITAWFPLASALKTEEWDLLPGSVVPAIQRFQVMMDGKPLEFQVVELPNPKGEHKPPLPWASFPVTFPAGAETNVQISYVVPAWWSYEGLAMSLFYIFQTGAGWAGPIGKAELVVNLPYPASAETIWRMPEGGQIEGHQVRWMWQNLEPGPQDDFFIQLLMIDRWDELQAARAAVAANPQDGEAWLNLASVYRTLTRGMAYSAARMLPGFGEIYQPLGVRAANEALRLLPGDGRPHDELALLYLSALSEDATWDDLKPVMQELKIVEELEPALAPNIHDSLEFLGVFWALETVRAEASVMPEPSVTTTPTRKAILTSTPIPSIMPETPPTVVPAPLDAPGNGQSPVLLVAVGVLGLFIVGYLAYKILQKSAGH